MITGVGAKPAEVQEGVEKLRLASGIRWLGSYQGSVVTEGASLFLDVAHSDVNKRLPSVRLEIRRDGKGALELNIESGLVSRITPVSGDRSPDGASETVEEKGRFSLDPVRARIYEAGRKSEGSSSSPFIRLYARKDLVVKGRERPPLYLVEAGYKSVSEPNQFTYVRFLRETGHLRRVGGTAPGNEVYDVEDNHGNSRLYAYLISNYSVDSGGLSLIDRGISLTQHQADVVFPEVMDTIEIEPERLRFYDFEKLKSYSLDSNSERASQLHEIMQPTS